MLRSHVELVESVGLDEAYLDLTGLERPRSAARRVKEAIRAETGLVCSVGIGPSKLVAKVASDAEKPDGFVELTAEQARERFSGASPGLVPGIGPKTVARLERLGVTTLGALGSTTDIQLIEWFGRRLGPHLGGELKAMLREIYGTLGWHPWAKGPHPWRGRRGTDRARALQRSARGGFAR